MSRANIYIRKENEEAWESIENKSDWVNEKLAGVSVSGSREKSAGESQGANVSEQQPATKKADMCKEHGVPKEACKLMKHK